MPSNVSAISDERTLTFDVVGQFTYCLRRYHLMNGEGCWNENEHTIKGRHTHRRVDRLDHMLPNGKADDQLRDDTAKSCEGSGDSAGDHRPRVGSTPIPIITVPLTSSTLGLAAKLDLVATDDRLNDAAPLRVA